MTTLKDIQRELNQPFSIEHIDLLPKGSIERDGKVLCMALPYADKRVYEDRLNELAPGEWSTPAPVAIVANNKLINYVTVVVCGIPHTDVGEAPLVTEKGAPSENAGTEAYAQAFKRACSQFGLGRYLYDLDKQWVPYNKQYKRIDLDNAGIKQTVRQMYAKAGIGKARAEANRTNTPTVAGGNKNQATAQTADPQPTPQTRSLKIDTQRSNELYLLAKDAKCCTNLTEFRVFAEHVLGLEHPLMHTDDLTEDQANDVQSAIETRKRQMQASAPAQQSKTPTGPLGKQNKALLDMIAKAKKRIEATGVLWNDAKRDAQLVKDGQLVKDEDLVVAQVSEIFKVAAEYEKRALAPAV